MISREQIIDHMKHYSLSQTIVVLAADSKGLDDAAFSHYLRGRRELSAHVLDRIGVALSALATLVHDGHPFPLNFRSPAMPPLIREYVARHEQYLKDKANFDAMQSEKIGIGS